MSASNGAKRTRGLPPETAPGAVRLTAVSVLHDLYQPGGRCERRVFLGSRFPELAAPPTEFDELLFLRAREHEAAQASQLAPLRVPNYPAGNLSAGAEATRVLINGAVPAIHGGILLLEDEGLVGVPDFLIRDGSTYAVRDAKLAQNLDEHPEIALQLGAYAYLLERSVGLKPSRMEVVLGTGRIEPIDSSWVKRSRSELRRAGQVQRLLREPDGQVGWSRCSACRFFGHCWPQAVQDRDPGIVPGVDKGMRRMLISAGFRRYEDVLRISPAAFALMERPWGRRTQRVGEKLAERILRQIRVFRSGKHEVFGRATFPAGGSRVYFDVESDPYDPDVGTRVYLWGLLLEVPDRCLEYRPVMALPGEAGDEAGWRLFMEECERLFAEFGQVCFVHYSGYERNLVEDYRRRYGGDSLSSKVLQSLWDMKAHAVDPFVCLPMSSYGLKALEKYAGFKRRFEKGEGLWSIGRYYAYLRATDQTARRAILDEICSYNEDDCRAMLHCTRWLQSLRQEPA